jgi:hypothetical protein
MTTVTLRVPLQMPRHQGFFNLEGNAGTLLGRRLSFIPDRPYSYLILEGVPVDDANTLLRAVRRCLIWAAVRLDQGILTSSAPLKYVEVGTFDGQFATAYPDGSQATPLRIETNQRSEEPSSRLFAALDEGARQTNVIAEVAESKRLVACEIFSAVDFDLSANAQFLALSMVLEVLCAPKQRPSTCVDLVEELLEKVESSKASADAELAMALTALQDSAKWLKQESITSSIQKLATKTAAALGDENPVEAGKKGAALYTKRSQLVHRSKSVTQADVYAMRKLARECLAVEMGCYHAIRERFP